MKEKKLELATQRGTRHGGKKVEDNVKAIKALEHTYKRPGTKPRKEWQEGNEKLT